MPVMDIKVYPAVDKWSDLKKPIDDPTESFSESFNYSPEDYFNYWVACWHKERAGMSSPDDIFNCEAYKEILLMGRGIEQFILKKIRSEKLDFWFDALERINFGFSPVNEDDAGDFRAINEAWVKWYSGFKR